MKKIRLYFPNVLLTFLLVFFLMGSEGLFLAKRVALGEATFAYLTQHQQLAQKGYDSFTSYCKTRSNSTGIPESVFLNAVTEQDLRQCILDNSAAALRYLNGSAQTYEYTAELPAIEPAVRAFFEKYADERGYEKDETYEAKLAATVTEAQAKLTALSDPFRFGMLRDNGYLAKLRTAVSYLNTALIACIAGAALLLVLLILCNLRQLEHLGYWVGLAAAVSGILTAAPCIYLTAADVYSGFALKDPQTYAAVVGYLRLITSRGLTMAIVTVIVGLIGIIGFAFLRAVQREEAEE